MWALPTSRIKSTERVFVRDSNSLLWLLVRFFFFLRTPLFMFIFVTNLLFHPGESGLGKSTLINTLFNTTLYPPKEPLPPAAERPKTVAIESIGAGQFSLRDSWTVYVIFVGKTLYRYRGKRRSSSSYRCRYPWVW